MSTMNPKGTMDYGFLLDLFETDELDNILDAIIEAAVARRNYLQDVQGAQNKATMVPGTRVRICGTIKPKPLSERMHRCECGCVLDRDVAAAHIVHLRAFGARNWPSVAKPQVAAA